MTTGSGRSEAPPRTASGMRPSVRQWGAASAPIIALVGLVGIAAVVYGSRILAPAYPGGDLLYHGALALGLLHGAFPLEGAYAGLPAYYPPGYHALLALVVAGLGVTPLAAAAVLFVALLPVLPVGTFLLARRVTGRPWVAIVAVALTLFGGAYNLTALRQWVNSLFVGGQAAYTLFPRDVVFAILPLAAWSFLHALEPVNGERRWAAWAAGAGVLLGAAALVQVQLLLPIPFALGAAGLALAARDPRHRAQAVVALAVTGAVALLVVAPWLAQTADEIRRNGGVALDSSDQLEPARFGFWSYPREFGLLLPFGIVGAGVGLLLLGRPDGPRPLGAPGRWHPSPTVGGLLLAVWWALPFVLGIAYNPSWPLEDALRPQRLWLIASQPLAILAAIGLVAAAEHLLGRRRATWVAPAVAIAVLVSALPATAATVVVAARAWTTDTYAMLDRRADHVPGFDALLGRAGPRETVLAPEDWSAPLWFETGLPVVALVPPGYAKLAFDPGRFTPASQDQRRAAMVQAWSGDPAALTAVADQFGATRIVIPRDGNRWALVDEAVAALARADPAAAPGAKVATGNGWDAIDLEPGGRLLLPAGPTGAIALGVRVTRDRNQAAGAVQLRVLAVSVDGSGAGRLVGTLDIPAANADWRRGRLDVDLRPGERLTLEATTTARIQAVIEWTNSTSPPAGWQVATETSEAIVLERIR